MREIILTPDLSNSGNFEQLWFLWQKSPPPHSQDEGKFFDIRSTHFMQFWANLVFVAEKSPLPPRDEGIFFDTRSIHFRQFWATLVFVAEKPPPQDEGKFFGHQIYPFQAILSKFSLISGGCFSATKIKVARNCLKLFISWIFEQLWFLWQKSPPPPPSAWGKNFWHQIYLFQEILRNFGLCGRKTTPTQDEGKFFDTRSIHFRQFWATLVLWQKSPSQDEGKFFDTRYIHFRQFWATLVLWQKIPPPHRWGKLFWHQIYPIQAISSNFGFCGRKAPPSAWGKNFWHQIYPFQEIVSNFGLYGRKATPTQDEGKIFDIRSIHFRQFWATLVLWQKSPPSPQMREIFLTPDLSTSGNFEQLWFLWQKSPPPHSQDEGKIFDIRSIHFRQFWATLVFVAEKPPPHSQDEGEFLTPDLSISGNFEQLWFCGRIVPPPHRMRENFWHQIYQIQAILSNLVLWQKSPPPRMRENFLTPDLSISGNL